VKMKPMTLKNQIMDSLEISYLIRSLERMQPRLPEIEKIPSEKHKVEEYRLMLDTIYEHFKRIKRVKT